MKAAVLTRPEEFSIEINYPLPKPGPEEILVQVKACGVCGTDSHIYKGDYRVQFPVIPGHEFSGIVVEAGEKAYLQKGDRVTLDPNISDGTCVYCRQGKTHLCENLQALGVNMNGGFAEYCLAPHKQAYRIPDSISFETAAFTEPLACCIHGIDRAEIKLGDSVVILGSGPIGILLMQLARLAGAGQIIVSEPMKARRELAASFGADLVLDPTKEDVQAEVLKSTKVGANVVIEAAGIPPTVEIAPSLTRRGGMILLFGVSAIQAQAVINPYDIFNNELTLRGSFVNPYTHQRSIDLLASGKVDVKPLISHRFGIEETERAIKTSRSSDALKVMVIPD